VNPIVGTSTVSWSMADGNGTDGNVTFLDGSANTYIWGPTGRTGVLFEGGVRFPWEGWLDFRGVRTCVPTATCEGTCGTIFDGCQAIDCGYLDTCGTCIDRTAAPAVLLHSDPTDRAMFAACSDYPLVPPRLIEEASAEVRAGTSAISDAWVYFRDEDGAYVGDIRMNPANYGTVARRVVFPTPIAVSGVHICSWWNPATLLQLDLYGDPAACTP
jgi:hypothetical protein